MKRGLRLGLVAGLCLHVSGMYALHPRGIALACQLLLERRQWPYALLLLSEVAVVVGSLWFMGLELAAYVRWKRDRAAPQDAEREASWAVALHRFGMPVRLVRALAETGRQAWHERRRTWARAERRWPQKKRELSSWLARQWSRAVWVGVGVVVGGEALTALLSYRIPGTLTPVLSLGAVVAGMAVGNALVLLAWVAGDDDDEGGPRSFPLPPRPPRGHKRPKHVRQTSRPGPQPSLRVQRSGKARVPQA